MSEKTPTVEAAVPEQNQQRRQARAGPKRDATTLISAPSVSSEKDWFSQTWEKIRPVKELVSLIAIVIGAIATGVTWSVEHFATRRELVQMRCFYEVQLTLKALPPFITSSYLQSDQIAIELQTEKQRDPNSMKLLRLSDQLEQLKAERDAARLQLREAETKISSAACGSVQ